MRRTRGPFTTALLLGLWMPAAAAWAAKQDDVDRVIAAGRAESRVTEHLDHLCNRIGPRLTGSDALQTACEWARERFAAFGLANARLEKWGDMPVGFNRGPWRGRVVAGGEVGEALTFATPAWSAGTRGVVRGRVVLAPATDDELAGARGRLTGSWVFTPSRVRGTPQPKPEFLEALGRVYDEEGVAGVVRSSRGDLILTDGDFRVSWENLPTRPTIRLLQRQFDEIAGRVRAGHDVTVEFDVRNDFKKGPIPVYNVVADLVGTDFPDEYVIVGGHLDSWDGATGATDNGTGVSTTLEAARILVKAGVTPRRTIRFMLWSGEEQGLLGSRAYVKANPGIMPRVSAVLVHDMGTNPLSSIRATEAMASDFRQVFAPVAALDPAYPFEVKAVDGLSAFGSDHDSFLDAGVPAFFWGQSGRASYQRTHHTQFDTFDAAVPEYQAHSALVVALAAYGIAGLDHPVSREKLRGTGPGGGRRLGVELDGTTVARLAEDGVAEKGGMLAGDVILSIDGTRVADRDEVVAALRAGGASKKVVVLRDGKELTLRLQWPGAAARGQ